MSRPGRPVTGGNRRDCGIASLGSRGVSRVSCASHKSSMARLNRPPSPRIDPHSVDLGVHDPVPATPARSYTPTLDRLVPLPCPLSKRPRSPSISDTTTSSGHRNARPKGELLQVVCRSASARLQLSTDGGWPATPSRSALHRSSSCRFPCTMIDMTKWYDVDRADRCDRGQHVLVGRQHTFDSATDNLAASAAAVPSVTGAAPAVREFAPCGTTSPGSTGGISSSSQAGGAAAVAGRAAERRSRGAAQYRARPRRVRTRARAAGARRRPVCRRRVRRRPHHPPPVGVARHPRAADHQRQQERIVRRRCARFRRRLLGLCRDARRHTRRGRSSGARSGGHRCGQRSCDRQARSGWRRSRRCRTDAGSRRTASIRSRSRSNRRRSCSSASMKRRSRSKASRFVTSSVTSLKESRLLATTDGSVDPADLHPRESERQRDRRRRRTIPIRRRAAARWRPAGRGWEYVTGLELSERAITLRQRSGRQVVGAAVEPGTWDLVLHPSHLWLTIHESIAHPSRTRSRPRVRGQLRRHDVSRAARQGAGQIPARRQSLMTFVANRTEAGGCATVGWDDEGDCGDVVSRSSTKASSSATRAPPARLLDLVAPFSALKKAPGHSYGQHWASIPFPRMPNVSLQPAARDISARTRSSPRRTAASYIEGDGSLLDRSAAIQLPVRRADVLGDQERQEDADAARCRVCGPHP